MLGLFGVAVVLFNDLIEHVGKSVVAVMTTSIDTDSRVYVLTTRQDHLLEADSGIVLHASVLGEELRGQEPAE